MFLSSLLSDSIDLFEPIAKWLTVGVIALLLIVGAILFFVKRSVCSTYVKYAFFGVFFYSLVLAIVFLSLDIAHHYSDTYTQENWLDKDALIKFVFIPLLVFACTLLLSLTALALVNKFLPQRKRLCSILVAVFSVSALISALVCIAVYYGKKIAGDGYYNSDTATVKQIALYASVAITILFIVALAFLDKQPLRFQAKSLAYAGVLASMSFALSYIKLWDMPNGGSVTLVSTLPLMLYSFLFGTKKGVFVGFVYGTLQALQDPWIIHPAQFLLDYPIAFSAIGVAGMFGDAKFWKKAPQARFALGAIVAGALRFACHVLSGVFAFEAYSVGQNVWTYSLIYNSYVFIDVALVIVAGVFVLSSKSFLTATAHLRTRKKVNGENQ